MVTSVPPAPVLLYDGTCGFCGASVQFILRHDRTRSLLFAPLQSALGRQVTHRNRSLSSIDSMIWLDADGRAVTRSAAAIRVGRYLGGRWSVLATLLAIIPRPVRDW